MKNGRPGCRDKKHRRKVRILQYDFDVESNHPLNIMATVTGYPRSMSFELVCVFYFLSAYAASSKHDDNDARNT